MINFTTATKAPINTPINLQTAISEHLQITQEESVNNSIEFAPNSTDGYIEVYQAAAKDTDIQIQLEDTASSENYFVLGLPSYTGLEIYHIL